MFTREEYTSPLAFNLAGGDARLTAQGERVARKNVLPQKHPISKKQLPGQTLE
jgi:hypothetical protein